MKAQRYSISNFANYENLTEYQKEIIHRYMLSWCNSYIQDDVFHCTKCNCVTPVDKKLKKAIKHSKICPKCGNINDKIGRKFTLKYSRLEVGIKVDNMVYGYFCELINCDDSSLMSSRLVYVRDLNVGYGYKRGIGISGMGWCGYYWNGFNTEWKQTRNDNYYYVLTNFNKMEDCINKQSKSLKDSYLKYPKAELLKDNQKYLVRKNILSHKQIDYIIAFDLKKIEEVYKYSKYINAHDIGDLKDARFNIYTLDYLDRNNVLLRDYMDYMSECRELNIDKPYPKDFNAEHQKLSKLIRFHADSEKNAKYDELINERLKTLEQLAYSDKHYIIEPFKNTQELFNEGNDLSICIYSYSEKYANGKTDLFKVRDIKNPDAALVAVEIKDNKIIQQRAFRNQQPSADIEKFTAKWINDVVERATLQEN